MLIFIFNDKTKLGDGVHVIPTVRNVINSKFNINYVNAWVEVSNFVLCFNLGDQIFKKVFEGEKSEKQIEKVSDRFYKRNSADLTPEELASKILKQKTDIVFSVVHYKDPKQIDTLVEKLGAKEIKLGNLPNFDFSKSFICLDTENSTIRLWFYI